MTDKPDLKSRPVRAGETPLDDNLGHRYLDVIREGGEAFDNRTASPYSGHSLEHCLHATGWVQRDLRVALDRVLAERAATEARHAEELREQAERFSDAAKAVQRTLRANQLIQAQTQVILAPFILPSPDPLVEISREMTLLDGVVRTDNQKAAIREGRAGNTASEDFYDRLRAAMQARGYEWRKIGEAGE